MHDPATEETTSLPDDAPDGAGSVSADDALAAHRAVALAIAACSSETTDAECLTGVVQALKSTLGLSRAYVHLLEQRGGERGLRLAADAGSHSAFVMDAPSLPLDIDTAAARAATRGEPTWEGNAYGMGASESDHATGIARWRSAVQAQASATLPLTVRDRTLGALTLEWPELHEFDDAERETLAALAAAVAIGVDSLGQQQIREDAAAVPAIVRRSSAMLVSPDGAVGPAAAGTPAVPGATRVWVDAALPRADLQRAPFWDVVACEGRRVAIVAGAAGVAAGGADARAASARHMLRGWLVRGIDPGDALCSLAAWAAAEQPGASWLTVSVAVIDQTHRLCVAASAGPSVITFVGVDGRARTIRSSAPLLGGDEPYVAQESTRLLLPGDRVALWSGECAAAEEREGAAGPAAGLRREVPGAEAAAGLLGRTITTGPCCETAAVLEVL